MNEPIVVTRDGSVATVVLNNPGRLNALSKPMWASLRDTMRALSEETDLRCVVVRGAGEKAFAAGADISEFETVRSDAVQARAYDGLMREALEAVYHCVHPTVAMVMGACVGGGLEIAVHCDLRICGESARFGAPVNRLGMSMPCPEIEALERLAGPATAMEILLEGRILTAREAYEKGLVTRLVADETVEEEALATAGRIAAGAPLVNRWHKRFIHRLMEPRPIEEQEREPGYFYFETEDFKNGVAAFLAKRRPDFTGR